MSVPRRRFEVVVRIGADHWDGVQDMVNYAQDHLSDHRASLITGGVSCGMTIQVDIRPEITAERYQAALSEYCARRRIESPPPEDPEAKTPPGSCL